MRRQEVLLAEVSDSSRRVHGLGSFLRHDNPQAEKQLRRHPARPADSRGSSRRDLAILRQSALVITDTGIKIRDLGVQGRILRQIGGQNHELRFGLTGVALVEIKINEFE